MSILRNREPGRQPRQARFNHGRRSASAAVHQFLEHALAYALLGWSILPVIGKIAVFAWKRFQTRPPTPAELQEMFADPDITGLAVVTGQVSGVAVRDFDRVASYVAWADAYPSDAAKLPTVKTARGYHVYGALDRECYAVIGDGELRADSKHYVLLPPSIHPSGSVYSWLVPLPAPGQLLPRLPHSLVQGIPRQAQEAHVTQPTHSHMTCVRSNPNASIAEAIASTIPPGPDVRNRYVFELARALKAIIPKASRDELREIVRDWHARALPFIKTKDFTTTWCDFSRGWEAVKIPHGAALSHVAMTARASPLPEAAFGYDLPVMQELVSLCHALQQHHGPGKSWPLSCRMAAREIGVGHDTAARWIKLLLADGVLELAVPAGSKESRRAAEYRYIQGGLKS